MNDPVANNETSHEPGRTVVFVHGRDFKPAADELLELDIAAMAAGIERDCPEMLDAFHALDKRLAYYGDIGNAWLRESGKHYDEKLDIGDRRHALQGLRSVQKRKHFGVGRYDRLPGKNALAEFAADVAAPVLGSIGLAGKLIGLVARDISEYWNKKSDFGPRVRERVRSAIGDAMEKDGKIMLVSHGTGCIVAYDVLWQMSHDPEYATRYEGLKVDQWITLGAPLGDTTVRKRLFGTKSRGRTRYPTNILAWHNVAAEDDYMCHDNTLSDDYREMLKLRLVSSIRDYRIYNLAVRYGKSNPHSSLGYLVHPRVSKIVSDWLRQDELVSVPRSNS
jgi:hypothetical protein